MKENKKKSSLQEVKSEIKKIYATLETLRKTKKLLEAENLKRK